VLTNDTVSSFSYESDEVTYEQIMKICPEKSEMLEIKPNESVSQPISPWKHTRYGGIDYAIDEKGYYHDRQGQVWKPVKVDTTAYTWMDDGYDPSIGAGDGKTATGKDAKRTYGIASGSPMVPRGSLVHVAGYGQFEVDDTGGKLKSDWRKYRKVTLDLRVPQLRYDGVWRSIKECRAIAFKHGKQKDRMVLVLVK
jgi:3D (Asp-Asp-Asp) domain-containing protein